MSVKFRLKRPLPLIIESSERVYELQARFVPSNREWHLAARYLADGFVGLVSAGRATREELERALLDGVELLANATAPQVASDLVQQKRAEYLPPFYASYREAEVSSRSAGTRPWDVAAES